MSSHHWIVETTPDEFQSVSADELRVTGGCLVFQDWAGDMPVHLAFAAGSWLTVALDEDQ